MKYLGPTNYYLTLQFSHEGGSSNTKSGNSTSEQQDQYDGNKYSKASDQAPSRSNSINDGGPSWLMDKVNDFIVVY